MTPFTTHAPWFTLSQRKKARPAPTDTSTRYRKRKDMVSAPQPSSLPLLFAADSFGPTKSKVLLNNQRQQTHYLTPSQTPKASPQPAKATGNYSAAGRKRKPVKKPTPSEDDWAPPRSPFAARPPSDGHSSFASTQYCPFPTPPSHRASPPSRLSPDSERTGSGSSWSSQPPPVPPRSQRRIVSDGSAQPTPPLSTVSALGPRPIAAFPTSSRPSAGVAGQRPVSLPADTAELYNFFLGNNVTRKRVEFHEISPKDMRDLASDQRSNKRSFAGLSGSEQKRKTVKPRVVTFNGTLSAKRQAFSDSTSSVDKVWFASPAPGSKCT